MEQLFINFIRIVKNDTEKPMEEQPYIGIMQKLMIFCDSEEGEILKNDASEDVILKKGTFVYRLSGRDRQKSASYYTPEALTNSTVKYTLKPILERLERGEMKAIELLDLKLLEPAMGAAAFHNEMINQLSEAYLSYRQKELRDVGRVEWKVEPDKYKEELQRIKAYIATNNTYGVDLNPTAIELGKLSLWLNVIHKDMETPFFSNRICVGNAVVGAWLKVYKEKDLSEEYELLKNAKGKDTRSLIKKEWWVKLLRK
jgi:type II restriction/modification system DNA methylase subunit YeeA